MTKKSAPYLERQLPTRSRLSVEFIYTSIASLCSIASLLAAPFITPNNNIVVIIFSISSGIIVISLFAYIVITDSKKLHRYAQAVIHTHYVNHLIRDALQEQPDSNLAATTEKILTSIATCFSIITGKQCRTCLMEIKSNHVLSVIARDDISAVTSKRPHDINVIHNLSDNSDFHNLWYAQDGCSRYFLCNNLVRQWKRHKYRNSSFSVFGAPEIIPLGIFDVVYNWKLPYKSALVLPVRYVSTFEPPNPANNNSTVSNHWNFWGFLCIDANTTGCFDSRFSPELGGTFADALFTLFSQSNVILDLATTPKPQATLQI